MGRKRIVDDLWRSPARIETERDTKMILKDCGYDRARVCVRGLIQCVRDLFRRK